MKSFTPEKIRFKILKKGIVSQVMSLILLGGVSYANVIIDNEVNNEVDFNGSNESVLIKSNGSVVINQNNTIEVGIKNTGYILSGNNYIINEGLIDLSGIGNNVAGIVTAEMNETSYIQNNKTIKISNFNNNDGDKRIGGIVVSGDGGGKMKDASTVINNGEINITAKVNAYDRESENYISGIFVNEMNNASSVINKGSITINTTATSEGYYSYNGSYYYYSAINNVVGINVNMDGNASLTNEGSITIFSSNQNEYCYSNIAGINVDEISGNAKVINSGTITAYLNNGGNAGAISIYNMTGTSSLINSNTINIVVENNYTNSRSDVAGIFVYYMHDNTTVTNTGSINIDIANNNRNHSDVNGIYVFYMYNNSILTNNAGISINTINNNGSRLEVDGINVYEELYDNSKLVNNGNINIHINNNLNSHTRGIGLYVWDLDDNATVTNTGNIMINTIDNNNSNSNIYGLYINNIYENATATNAGNININVDNNDSAAEIKGLYIEDLYDNSTFKNTGNINIIVNNDENSSVEITGIYTQLKDANASFINSGDIIINANSNPTKTAIVGLNLDVENGAVFVNNGDVSAKVNGEYNKEVFALIGEGNGTIINNGAIEGNINIAQDANVTLINNGLINLPFDASGEYETEFSTLHQTKDGILEIGLWTDGNISNTKYTQIVAKNVIMDDGSTLFVNVADTSTNEKGIIGDVLQDVIRLTDANASIDLNMSELNVRDNSALLDFVPIIDVNTLDLNVTKGLSIQQCINDSGYDGATTAGGVLDNIQDKGNASGELQDFLDKLTTYETEKEVAKRVIEATPQDTLTNIGLSSIMSENIAGVVNSRFSRGMNSGDNGFVSQNLWVKVFAGKAKQDDKDNKNGFDSNYFGLAMGYEAEYDIGQKGGIALFLTKANTDTNNVDSSSDVDGYTLVGYGNIPMSEKDNLLYQLSFGLQKTDNDRYISAIDKTAHSDYTIRVASANMNWVRSYDINDNTTLNPNVGYTYRYIYVPSYTESGAGTMNLHVNSKTIREGLLGAGISIDHSIDNCNQLSFNANVEYDTIHDKESVTANFEGASGLTFETNGIDNGRWRYSAGINYQIFLKENQSLQLIGDYKGRGSSFRNYSGAIKYIWKF